MSVVAVRKEKSKITIGADSIRIAGWSGTQEKDKFAKLFQVSKDMILGAVGSAAVNALCREFLDNHLPKTNTEYGWTMLMRDFADHLGGMKSAPKFEDSSFVTVYRGKVFLLAGYFVRETKDYYAIGAGADTPSPRFTSARRSTIHRLTAGDTGDYLQTWKNALGRTRLKLLIGKRRSLILHCE